MECLSCIQSSVCLYRSILGPTLVAQIACLYCSSVLSIWRPLKLTKRCFPSKQAPEWPQCFLTKQGLANNSAVFADRPNSEKKFEKRQFSLCRHFYLTSEIYFQKKTDLWGLHEMVEICVPRRANFQQNSQRRKEEQERFISVKTKRPLLSITWSRDTITWLCNDGQPVGGGGQPYKGGFSQWGGGGSPMTTRPGTWVSTSWRSA